MWRQIWSRKHEIISTTIYDCSISIYATSHTIRYCVLKVVFDGSLDSLRFRDLASTNPNRFLINLSLALFLLIVVFLSGIERSKPAWACKITAVLIHYLSLVVFSWMSLEALNMILLFVIVMPRHISRFFLKSMLVTWGKKCALPDANKCTRTYIYARVP